MLTKCLVCLVLAVVYASAHQRRDVATTPTEDAFKEVINKAEIAVKEAGEHISKMLGLDQNAPTGEQVVELIRNQTKAFTVQAEAVQRQLENELKDLSNSTLATAFSDISKKIQETVTTFREQIESSGVGEQAAALQAKFQEGINTLVEEGKKLANNLEPQVNEAGKTLQNLTKKVIDEAVDNLNQLQQKVHTATGHEDQGGHNH
ncbi:UNVERIFIED_CONTAM: hypothetical protein PYX00_009151 [Menopon gallinae]|uniref:Apolipophorin-III n=1 Tax=Menopon gallinae TaxID=328185 RepID=A0AAW2HA93_9NEOP